MKSLLSSLTTIGPPKLKKKTAQIHHGGVQIAQIKAAKEIEILNFLLVAFLRIAKPPGAFSWPS